MNDKLLVFILLFLNVSLFAQDEEHLERELVRQAASEVITTSSLIPGPLADETYWDTGQRGEYDNLGGRGASPTRAIGSFPLYSEQINYVKVGGHNATVLKFPNRIEGIMGFGLTSATGGRVSDELKSLIRHADKNQTSVILYEEAAECILSLRVLKAGKPLMMTINSAGSLYVFSLNYDIEPHLAITYKDAESYVPKAQVTNESEVVSKRLNLSPHRLVGLLNLGRNRDVLESSLPAIYKDVEQRRSLRLSMSFDFVTTVITRIERFPKYDALFFEGVIENHNIHPIQFDPFNLQVRVGKRDYPASLADTAGVVRGKSTSKFYIILQGNLSGSREHLSIKNDFRIVLPNYKKYEESQEEFLEEGGGK